MTVLDIICTTILSVLLATLLYFAVWQAEQDDEAWRRWIEENDAQKQH